MSLIWRTNLFSANGFSSWASNGPDMHSAHISTSLLARPTNLRIFMMTSWGKTSFVMLVFFIRYTTIVGGFRK
jgi:hypothetical protein